MKVLPPILAAVLALSTGLALAEAQAGERRVLRAAGPSAAGTAVFSRQEGANGSLRRGRAFHADGQGNATAVRGASLQGSDGGSLERRTSRSHSSDGSRQSERSLSATGSQGNSLQSNGGRAYSAESGPSRSRTTSATSAATGNSVQGSTSYSRDGGLSHSLSCQDASGAAIACPAR